MKSRYVLYLIGVTVFSLVFGAVFNSWVLLVGAIGGISLLAVSLKGYPPDDLEFEVTRESEEVDLYEGSTMWVRIDILNKGDSLKFLEIKDLLPPKVEVKEGSNHQIIELKKGEKTTIEYKIGCPLRGETVLGPIEMRFRDPLSFYTKSWTIKNSLLIHILPGMEEIKSVNIRPNYTRNWLGNIQSSNIGIGTEFFSLREYIPGDDIRKINWKATARNMNPITNEYEGEQSGDVIIIVDAFKEGNIGTVRDNTMGASIRAAASLASSILDDRNRVGLIVLGDFLNWIYPGSGRDHFYKIMNLLSKSERGGTWKPSDAKWVLQRFFPGRSMIVFISPLIHKDITGTIEDICMKEFDVMVISPNPLHIEKKIGQDYEPLAEDVFTMKRENLINRLWKYSVVIDWDPNEPLEAALDEVKRYLRRA
ncbi:MAG: DUF58 domain-containing protein [Candidatus Saliniplasma sp.]